jgi:hypothetical protein
MTELTSVKEIDVLIVVDVEGALASGNLGDNVYLIDTNGFFGSGGEGQAELQTACLDGQIVIWSISSVDPGADVEIAGFTGQIIDQRICVPQQTTLPTGDVVWSGRVESQGAVAEYQYSCTLLFNKTTKMSFDPFLNVKSA